MPNDINTAYINAILADATYAFDETTPDGITGSALAGLDAFKTRMTPELAKFIADNFTVVTHRESGDVLGSGFDATVWKRNSDNKYFVSMQGTTGLQDFITDIDLTATGTATAQVMDMVNWWLKITTPANEQAQQFMYLAGPGNVAVIAPALSVDGSGLLINVESVSVNGHSLGGHLATSFARIFGGSLQIDSLDTFNSAGFNINSPWIFSQLSLLLGPGVSLNSYHSGQNNFYSENGISATTRDLLNIEPGTRVPLANEESDFAINNHFMYKISDLLALGNVMESLDGSLSFATLNKILDSGANETKSSIEGVLDGIRKTLGIFNSPTPVGDVSDSENSRVTYYKNLFALQDKITSSALIGNIQIKPSSDITVDLAKTDFSAFLSLYNLSPVYLAGGSAALQAANNNSYNNLYQEWSTEKFSDTYLEDRTAMLHKILVLNEQDADYETEIGDYYFSDSTINTNIGISGTRRFVFGSDNANDLYGGNKNDHLYGGGGNDTLTGNAGDDYLEGGAGTDILITDTGFDRLNGGEGNDTYQINANFGNVVISGDTDGGTISLLSGVTFRRVGSGETNKEGLYVAMDKDGKWLSGKEGWSVSVSGSTATVSILDGNKKLHAIVIENFNISNNKFGITFAKNDAFTANANGMYVVSTGEISPGFYLSGSRFVTDDPYRNIGMKFDQDLYAIKDFEGSNKNDVLIGKNLTEAGSVSILQGRDGDDVLYGDDDVVFADDDVSTAATEGNPDLLVGGRGNDTLFGGGGNDSLYASERYYSLTRTFTKTDDPETNNKEIIAADYREFLGWEFISGTLGDAVKAGTVTIENVDETNFLDGGAGEDRLYGANYRDTLIGGAGNDFLLAGAGKDVLSGGNGDDVLYGDSHVMNVENANKTHYDYSTTLDFVAPDKEISNNDRAYFYQNNRNDAYFNNTKNYNDVLNGGNGADLIFGEIGDDIISGGEGDDRLFGDRPYNSGFFADFANTTNIFQRLSADFQGNDFIDGGAGNDILIGGGRDDHLIGGDGDDVVYGDLSLEVYERTGTASHGETAITSDKAEWAGKDMIIGGQGNDALVGEGNDDVLDGGDGDDHLYGDWATWQNAAFTNESGKTGDDTLYGGAGADQLMGNSGDDVLDGGSGNDILYGDSAKQGVFTGTGKDVLIGGAGNDTLYGGAGVDTLDGGTGDDTLKGGIGDDVYVIGGGIDVIDDIDGQSTLYLSSKPVKTLIQGGNAIIYLSEDGSNRVQMNVPTFMAIKKVYVGDQSFDLEITVSDTQTNYVNGTGGNDTYVISDQYTGGIVLNDAVGSNALKLGDGWFNNGSLTVNASPNSNYSVTNNSNPLSSLMVSESSWAALAEIRLASGEVANLHIEGDSSNNNLQGLDGNDVINGYGGSDVLSGGAGNDVLNGGDGVDMLIGGAGDDTLKGGSGWNDILKGGEGNDILYISTANSGDAVDGEAGNDIFIAEDNAQSQDVHGGSGADTFTVNASNYSYYNITDKIFDVGDVIQLNVNSDSVNVFADGIVILAADKLSVSHSALRFLTGVDKETLWERMQNLTIRFADGEIWNVDDIKTHSSAGSMFDDEIVGDTSANTLHGHAGNDVIDGVGGNDTLYGDEGNDQLSGGAGNDVLVGGAGEDWLSGGAGEDTFHFGAGQESDFIDESARGGWAADADVIQLDSAVSDTSLSRSDLDLVIAMTTGETMTLKSFFSNDITHERNVSIRFSGGTQWDTARIQQEIFRKDSGFLSYSIIGTSAANTLNGNTSQIRNEYFFGDTGSDTIDGKSGNDWIDGGAGNDILTGGSGADTFRFGAGSGQDVIKDNAAAIVADRVRLDFTTGISNLTVEVLASTNELKIGRHDATGAVTDSVQVNKALGSLVDIQGNRIDMDSLSLLEVINNELANRTITVTRGTLESGFVTLSAADLLGNNLSDIEKSRWQITGATKLSGVFGVADLDGNGSTEEGFALIENFWGSGINYVGFVPSNSAGSASFQFTLQRDDGLTLVSSMTVNAQAGSLSGTNGNDIIDGAHATDIELVINALAGDDLVRDGECNDVIHGGDGNDVLTYNWAINGDDVYYGDAGNDTLDAGLGTDTMVGGSGNDLYIESNLWSGDHTTIDNSTAAAGDIDTLQIGGSGFGMQDYRSLWFTQAGNDLVVTQLDAQGTGDIRIKNWFDAANPEAKLDVIRVQQDDGSVYETHVDLHFDALVQAMAGFASPASVGAIDNSLNDEYKAAWMLATPMAA